MHAVSQQVLAVVIKHGDGRNRGTGRKFFASLLKAREFWLLAAHHLGRMDLIDGYERRLASLQNRVL